MNPGLEEIRAVCKRAGDRIHNTPVLESAWFNEQFGGTFRFKCENFQKTGSFKARGALNAVMQLNPERAARGVATHSSGNHAAALARAAAIRNIPAYIVMPENAPDIKKKAVQAYKGRITYCKPGLQNRESTLEQVIEETGAAFIPPYNHEDVIMGQATAALELLDAYPDTEVLIAPVGGGGLLSGSALSGRLMNPGLKIYGAEPEKAADARESFITKKLVPVQNPDTIADGLRTSLGQLTFNIITKNVDDILTVSEADIIRFMRMVWERMKIIIEPSCSVPVACLKRYPELFRGKKTGIILTGGNVDLDRLPWQL